MADFVIARAVHVLGVVLWIGGVATVTTVLLPTIRGFAKDDALVRRAERDPDGTLRLIQRGHWVLLTLSLVTVAGAVAGSHGWSFRF